MKRRALWLFVSFLTMAGACGSSEASPAPSSAPPARVAAPAPPSSAPPSSVIAPSAAQLSAAQRATLTAALADARRLAGEQSWDAAATRFEAALALVPADVDVRCETGYAQFRASHLDAAAAHMRLVLASLPSDPPARRRERTAQCLYNVGRVAEARGDTEAARDAYARSIALRPNETVSTHLAALPASAAAAPSIAPTHQWISLPDGADDAAVVAAIHEQYCRGWDPFGTPCPADLGLTDVAAATSSSPASSVRIARSDDGYTDYLVVRIGAATHFVLLSDWYESFGCATGDATYTQLTLADLVAGGPLEVSFAFDGGCSRDVLEESWHVVQICRFDGTPRCVRLDTDFDGSYSPEWTGESEQETVSHHAELAISGAQVTVTNGSGARAFDPASDAIATVVGTRSVASLFDMAALAWPLPDP